MDRDEAISLALDCVWKTIRESEIDDQTYERRARAALLASLDASGWAVAPKEATAPVMQAAFDTWSKPPKEGFTWAAMWSAMLAASQEKDRPHE